MLAAKLNLHLQSPESPVAWLSEEKSPQDMGLVDTISMRASGRIRNVYMREEGQMGGVIRGVGQL